MKEAIYVTGNMSCLTEMEKNVQLQIRIIQKGMIRLWLDGQSAVCQGWTMHSFSLEEKNIFCQCEIVKTISYLKNMEKQLLESCIGDYAEDGT